MNDWIWVVLNLVFYFQGLEHAIKEDINTLNTTQIQCIYTLK